MLQVVKLKKEFSSRVLFEDVSVTLSKGEKVGLVGRNGSGKTTFFKILMGKEVPSEGEIQIPKAYKVAWLEQHINFTHDTVLNEVASVLAQPQMQLYKAQKILAGLGFDDEKSALHPSEYSGGYQLRINLAKALLQEPDLLLLDEPTNYLDISSIRWLKKFLKALPSEVIIISHDRDFIDEVCDSVMGINRGRFYKIAGDTDKYYQLIADEEENYEKTRQNQEKKIKDAKRFISKFRAKARQASLAQSRMKMLEKMNVLEELSHERDFTLSFRHCVMPGKVCVETKDLSFSYDSETPILNNFNLSISKSDKVAVIGPNGKGKSTLLQLIAKDLVPQDGKVHYHPSLKIGYFGQTNINRLSAQATVLDEVLSESHNVSTQQARDLCGAMLFTGDDVHKKINVLSGGERSRVMLAKIMAGQRNLLLLDEPTNHLDQESIEILLDELNAFEGAVVMVAHSEYILKHFANKLVIFDRGEIRVFDGTYQEFLDRVGWDDESSQGKGKERPKLGRKEVKRMRTEIIQERSKKLKPIRDELEKLEACIIADEARKEEVDQKLIELATSSDGSKIQDLSIESGKLGTQIENNFSRLEELTVLEDEIGHEFQHRLDELEELE